MTTIKLKNGSGAPTAGDLVQGEPALDLTNKRLYTEDSGGTVIEVGTNPGTDVTFADNRKAIFGAGSDLQIYHTTTGNHSIITESGSGNLILAADNLEINNAANNANKIVATTGGAVTLFHNNAAKLATTSTGIDVTGTVTADGLTVSKTSGDVATLEGTGTTADVEANLVFNPVYDVNARIVTAREGAALSSRLSLETGTANDFSTTERLRIAGNGDISFYEDTGTTAKLFWDASAESLGIGTTSPIGSFTVADSGTPIANPASLATVHSSTTDKYFLKLTSADFNADGNWIGLGMGYSSGYMKSAIISEAKDAYGRANLHFALNNSTSSSNASLSDSRMVIDYSGNVGIGCTPSRNLDIQGTGDTLVSIVSPAANQAALFFGDTDSDSVGRVAYDNSDNSMRFTTNASETMRIDASGNLLVGTTQTATQLAATSSEEGMAIDNGGLVAIANSGQSPLVLNRLSSDGNIINFHKNGGTPVGSIGTAVGNAYFAGTSTGITFGSANLYPTNSSGTKTDAALDLGSSSNRFKDLYLSGGVRASTLKFENLAGTTEYGRFDSSGNLLVGQTSESESFVNVKVVDGGQAGITTTTLTGSSASTAIRFRNGNGVVGSIVTSGSATAYNTSSDQRLKDNIVNAPSASDDIDAIQVRSFDWKADGSHQKYGMVAQELQSVAPEAVSGDADSEDMMGVDYSKLVPMLIKEIQSLRARVAQLEGAN